MAAAGLVLLTAGFLIATNYRGMTERAGRAGAQYAMSRRYGRWGDWKELRGAIPSLRPIHLMPDEKMIERQTSMGRGIGVAWMIAGLFALAVALFGHPH